LSADNGCRKYGVKKKGTERPSKTYKLTGERKGRKDGAPTVGQMYSTLKKERGEKVRLSNQEKEGIFLQRAKWQVGELISRKGGKGGLWKGGQVTIVKFGVRGEAKIFTSRKLSVSDRRIKLRA